MRMASVSPMAVALQLLLILVALHESPHWLASRGLARRAERARAALATKSSSSAVPISPVGLPDTDERALLCGGGGLRELGRALWAARCLRPDRGRERAAGPGRER